MSDKDNKSVQMDINYPAKDGAEEDIIDQVEKEKEQLDKDTEKELKDRVKTVDDINSAEEEKAKFVKGDGKAFKIKQVTEKLTLDESDDKLLNEDAFDDKESLLDGEPGISFANDVYDALIDVAVEYDADFGDMPQNELKAIFVEAFNIFLERRFGGVDESLDEALPKDLANAYKRGPYKIGSGTVDYGNITRANKGTEVYRTIDTPRWPAHWGSNGDSHSQYDFKNSTYKEITPEEAYALKKSGDMDKLRIIFDGQLVAFNSEGKPIYKATKNYKSDDALYYNEKKDEVVDHTTLLPLKTVLQRASKIYYATEKAADTDLQARRSKNSDSNYFDFENTDDKQYIQHDLLGNVRKGIDPHTTSHDLNRDKRNLANQQKKLEELNSKRDQLNTCLEDPLHNIDILNKYLQSPIYTWDEKMVKSTMEKGVLPRKIKSIIEETEYEIEDVERNVRYYNKKITKAKRALQDYQAYKRNISSTFDLQSLYKEFNNLKSTWSNVNDNLKKAQKDYDYVKANGSPEVARRKQELEDNKRMLRGIQKQIARLELYLESADEDNEAEIQRAAKEVEQALKAVNEVKDRLRSIRKTGNEALEDEQAPVQNEQELDESAKIFSTLDNYKPWSGAVDTYNTVKDAGKLEDLDALIEELYPEGIDETQLNDILWFESDWVFESLGMESEEEPDEVEGEDNE